MKPQKKVLVLKAPLTYILINEDRDSEQAKENWLQNREIRLNPPKDVKDKWKLHIGAYITPLEDGNYQVEVKGFLSSALIGLDKIHENSEPKHNLTAS